MRTPHPMFDRARRRGANAIEFALTMPVFLAFMLGVIDYGYVFMAQAILDAAAMGGTRDGAITDPNLTADIEGVAETRAASIASTFCGGDCSYSCDDQGNPPDRELVCDLTWNITPISGFFPVPSQIHSDGRQLLEWQRARP